MYSRVKGFLMASFASAMWGLSGTVAQELFEEYGFIPGYLVTLRMLTAGAALLMIAAFLGKGNQLLAIWKHPKDRLGVVIFGVLGVLGTQYTFFSAIDTGNAATAALLQFLAPLIVTAFLALRLRKMPTARELIALPIALFGTALLVTNGRFDELSVPGIAVFWGLMAAGALAFYVLFPTGLLKRWNSLVVIGWSMLIGGVGLFLLERPWLMEGQIWTLYSSSLVLFVILFGTLIAFFLYLESLRFISQSETSMLSSVEPLVAVVASVLWLQVPFGFYEAIGGLCIVLTVMILSIAKKEYKTS
ncbi:DMT family transporter [Tumebacillus lipolyticus]|uniref:DMT family transporter n=1 Tax=Tumebacillus lipolyticus TaxID=1280370 RepID=A0ABW4ZSK3_9BACL